MSQSEPVRPTQSNRMWVPKVKVPAKLHTTCDLELQGCFYTDTSGPGGTPGRVLDRLNDAAEKFVPLALETHHVLVRKSALVTVELDRGRSHVEVPEHWNRALQVVLRIDGGLEVVGTARVHLPAEHARVLDFLNRAAGFVSVLRRDAVVIVNVDHVTSATEVLNEPEVIDG